MSESLRDDRAPAAGLHAGDVAVFEAVFRAHYAGLCRFATRLTGSGAVAEELVQEVFRALWAERTRLEIRGSLRAYLYTATRNRSLNEIRQQHRAAHVELTPASPPTPEHELEHNDIAASVRAAIETLSPTTRRVVELRWLDGLSYAEIAVALDIAPKTVENHLARAKQLLRERLPKYLE